MPTDDDSVTSQPVIETTDPARPVTAGPDADRIAALEKLGIPAAAVRLGSAGDGKPAKVSAPAAAPLFRGSVSIREHGVILLQAGGDPVELLMAADPPVNSEDALEAARRQTKDRFAPYRDSEVTVTGRRDGGVVRGARTILVPAHTGGAKAIRVLEATIRDGKALTEVKTILPYVISLRVGYQFQDGWITDQPTLIATVPPEKFHGADELKFATIGSVQLAPATPDEQLVAPAPITEASFPYLPPPDGSLIEIAAKSLNVVCHASPDSGFPTLREFFGRATERLVIAMYDFSALHVLKALEAAMERSGAELVLVLDPQQKGPTGDLRESAVLRSLKKALGARLQFTWAGVANPKTGVDGLFHDYHIKVAVADNRFVWLSSGNWQSSNQPDVDPFAADAEGNIQSRYNREWHIVVDNRELAATFERFLMWDFEQANALPGRAAENEAALSEIQVPEVALEAGEDDVPRYFPAFRRRVKGARVRPLLTPDAGAFARPVLDLLRAAEKTIYFQNQSLSLRPDNNRPELVELADALRDQMAAGLDVRIILSDLPGVRSDLEQLKRRDFDMKRVKVQGRCHNKGLVVDGDKVVIGSHNWTNAGVTTNRDASLLISHRTVAHYYEEIFLYDWTHLARQKVTAESLIGAASESGMPIVRSGGLESTLGEGRIAVPFRWWMEG